MLSTSKTKLFFSAGLLKESVANRDQYRFSVQFEEIWMLSLSGYCFD